MYRTAIRYALVLAIALFSLLLCFWRAGVHAGEGDPVRPARQEVETRIDDRNSLAVTTIRQELINSSREAHSGSCLLPISDQATILRFRVIDPPPKTGENADERGSLQPAGRNTYRVECPVPPRGRARFQVVYAEALTRRGRRRKYIYPIPDPDAAPPPTGLTVAVSIDAAAPPQRISGLSHAMTVRRPAPSSVVLEYESDAPADGRDLVIDYELPPAADDTRARLAVLTPADRNQDPSFLLTLPPPATLLHGRGALEKPVDVIFCMDISGSTKGRKLDAIREAVKDGLADLAPGDRFGVVAFDDDARAFRRSLAPAAPGTIERAVRFVNRLGGGGGSDPGRGMRVALEILGERPARNRKAIVAVVVDSEDPADLASAASELGFERRGIRLAALGALSDSRLVDYRIRGGRLQAGPAIALSRAAMTYGPAFSAAAFSAGSLNASYIYPAPERLPDLPLSTPILLLGRLSEAPPARGRVRLAGKLEGVPRTLEVDYVWRPLDPASPVAALWANRRIRRLHTLAGRDRGDQEELSSAAGRVQKEHRLVAIPGE